MTINDGLHELLKNGTSKVELQRLLQSPEVRELVQLAYREGFNRGMNEVKEILEDAMPQLAQKLKNDLEILILGRS